MRAWNLGYVTRKHAHWSAGFWGRGPRNVSIVDVPSRVGGAAGYETSIIIITSEFLVVLSQHVRKTGNPIRLLDLLKSCDMKEN